MTITPLATYAYRAQVMLIQILTEMERVTRFELATYALARRRSTAELNPHTNGSGCRIRTYDPPVNSRMLYR
jgi:hypothetical protein